MLLDTPLPCGAEALMPISNAKVALFNVNLVPSGYEGFLTNVQSTCVNEDPNLYATEVVDGKGSCST